jgi:gliding motility-associated-like protein
MRIFRLFFFLLTLFIGSITGFAQGKINGPVNVCLGDLSNFSYTPPSGTSIISINWDFGDGNNSTNTSPSHTYSNKGKITVKVQASLNNSSVTNDSFKLEVFGLPKAAFYMYNRSDSCLNRNHICFYDTSSPAKIGQTLTQRLFVWGDGSFETKNLPKKGDSLCYTYTVADKYTLRMELTDNKGCKSSVTQELNIIQTIDASFIASKNFVNCYKAQICMVNKSSSYPINKGRYRWIADTSAVDTNAHITNSKCVQYSKTRSGKISLLAFVNPVCVDTMTQNFTVKIDSLPTKINLDDTVVCYSNDGLNLATITDIQRDDIRWYLDNALYPLVKNNEFYFTAKRTPGIHTIKVEIVRGTCITTLTGTYRVKGPVASFKLIDNLQCYSDRDVFMFETSKFTNKANCKMKWEISDKNGDNCIQERIKDINKYKNCNTSLDWFNKHTFLKNSGKSRIKFTITDTVQGCLDTTSNYVDMSYCSPILDPDTFFICQAGEFYSPTYKPFAKKFTIDSGKTWLPFTSFIDAKKVGDFKIGFMFETEVKNWSEHYGDDSIFIHKDSIIYRDTVYRNQILRIRPLKQDSIYFKVYGKCKPYRVTFFFKDGRYKKDEKLLINWVDKGNIDLEFKRDTIIDSVMHVYNTGVVQAPILIVLTSAFGCEKRYRFDTYLGKLVGRSYLKPVNCINDVICFNPVVLDAKTSQYWTGNTAKNYVKWIFPDTSAPIYRFRPCIKFTSGGLRPYKIIAFDSLGCSDTMSDSVFIQAPVANTKFNSKYIYCSELKQFYDSSFYNKYPAWRKFSPGFYLDSITSYSWQFGKGTFSSLKKNPVQSINTSLDSIPGALATRTVSGCVDTAYYFIKVIGSKPYFFIKDTIGCQSLTATFINKSRNCRQYIWQFGDSGKTTLQKFDKQNVQFTYNKPGRYYISLIGIDTVYNPFTKQYQYCYNTFPDKVFQKDTNRSVLVLPFKKTGITSLDTICIGSTLQLNSLSDTAYKKDYWSFGDSNSLDTNRRLLIGHKYKKAGQFIVKLNPSYLDKIGDFCRDSAQKTITVLGVKADFNINPNSLAPLFKFNNLSNPGSAGLNWDFGQAGPGNTSSEQNPEKNYGNDTGTYTVCLIASIPFGCADTICKILINDHLSDFGIFNVFTPGNIDNYNDQYDILIENESLYDLKIYDRWGVLVYQADKDNDNTQNENWNGTVMNNGVECSAGTYYYIFRYSIKNKPEEIKTIQGVIQLIR